MSDESRHLERRLVKAASSLAGEMQLSGLVRRMHDLLQILPGVISTGIGVVDDDRGVLNLHALVDQRDDDGPSVADAQAAAASDTQVDTPMTEPDSRPLSTRSVPLNYSEAHWFREGDPDFRCFRGDLRLISGNPLIPPSAGRHVCTPMRLGERVVGVLSISFRPLDNVEGPAQRFIIDLARIATPVLWNCFTHERFTRGDRRRDTLVALSNSIYTSLEFEAVIRAASHALEGLELGAPSVIYLLEPDGKHCICYWVGLPDKSPAPDPQVPPAKNPDAVIEASSPPASPPPPVDSLPPSERCHIMLTAVQPMLKDPRTFQSWDLRSGRGEFVQDTRLNALGIQHYVATAMQARGRVIGALLIGSVDPLPALKMDVWLYENMAVQLALAIDNARQHQTVRRLSDRLSQQNVYLREEIHREHDFSEMIGQSPAMDRVLAAVQRVAPTDATVLISGETGVGKELVARAIHAAGGRANQPMVKVNCAAIPEGTVESELFGHERGAFTSAVERRIGRFELAIDGTLFLDEVGELPLAVQAKLLRVLQDGEFERVGGSKTLTTNARIIAATNRDLLKSVEAGVFRRDLYYRLNVFPVNVPPLAERRKDIPLLVEAFVAQFGRRTGRKYESIDRDSLDDLCRREWPGNIRELRHVIERATILCEGPVLFVDRAPSQVFGSSAGQFETRADQSESRGRQRAARGEQGSARGDHRDTRGERDGSGRSAGGLRRSSSAGSYEELASLDRVKAEHIRRALQRTEWVIEGPRGAARILGLKPSTLRYQIKRLGLMRTTS